MNGPRPKAQFLLSKGLTTWLDDEWVMKAKSKDLNVDLPGRVGASPSFEEISRMLGKMLEESRTPRCTD